MLTDDTFDPTPAADLRRAEAATAVRTWRGKRLLWTFSRESLFEFIRLKADPLTTAQQAAMQRREACEEGTPEHTAATAELMRMLGGRSTPRLRNAVMALWLMTHQPEDWNAHPEAAALRSIIDHWSDEHLTTATEADLLEVVRLVDLVIEDTETTRAIPRPASHPPREDEGN